MSVVIPSLRGAIAVPGWAKNELWRKARAVPSLDLRFADSKSLTDATTGASLVTFTRASSGTFVGSDGVLQTAVTNLLLRSEEFGNAPWSAANAIVTSNDIAAPNGTITAEKVTDSVDVSNNAHQLMQGVAVLSGVPYTLSAFIRAGNGVGFSLGASPGAFLAEQRVLFNASTGVATPQLGTPTNITMTAVGDGWYRCSCTVTPTSSATATIVVRLYNSAASGFYIGDGTQFAYLWGAQLEQSSTVGEYIPTISTINSAPRFDHNPTTGESLGLLVEEQRTNSIRNNTGVGAVAGTPGTLPTNWVQVGLGSGLTSQVIGTGSQNGISYIDVRVSGTAGDTNGWALNFDGSTQIVASSGQSWTGSLYVAITGGSTAGMSSTFFRIIERTGSGSYVTESNAAWNAATSLFTTSSRLSVVRPLMGATTGFVQLGMYFNTTNGAAIDITLRIGLPQLEQGAFATSVIPTTTAAATRSADVASITGAAFSSWYRQDEGTVFIEGITAPALSRFAPELALSDGGDTNKIEMYNYTGGYGATVRKAGETNTDPILPLSPVSGAAYKKTLAIKVGDYKIAAQGQQGATANPLFIPSVSELKIGTNRIGSSSISSTIKRLAYWPARLGNEVLQRITQ